MSRKKFWLYCIHKTNGRERSESYLPLNNWKFCSFQKSGEICVDIFLICTTLVLWFLLVSAIWIRQSFWCMNNWKLFSLKGFERNRAGYIDNKGNKDDWQLECMRRRYTTLKKLCKDIIETIERITKLQCPYIYNIERIHAWVQNSFPEVSFNQLSFDHLSVILGSDSETRKNWNQKLIASKWTEKDKQWGQSTLKSR